MKSILTIAIATLCLGACQTTQPAAQAVLSEDFGTATRANIKAMAIAPTAEELNNRYIPADRRRAERAMEAYREGEIEELDSVQTGGSD